MKRLTPLSRVLAISALLVTATVFVASVAMDLQPGGFSSQRREFLVLVLAVLVTLLANAFLLRRRFEPLERLISTMERADLTTTGARAQLSRTDNVEVARLHAT